MNTMMKKKNQVPAIQVLELTDSLPLLLAGSEQPGTSTDHGTAHSKGYSVDCWEEEDY